MATRKQLLLDLAVCCEASDKSQTAFLLKEAYALVFPENYMDGRSGWAGNWLEFKAMINAEAYESAAIMLVPEGCLSATRTLWDGDNRAGFASVSLYEDAEHQGHYRRYWISEHQSNASTPALALTAASLRAIAEGIDE